jgi:hypothetical protein
MLAHIYETLEMNVGMKLAEQMTDAQLDEFEGYINRNDEAGALKWLESNFPNYKDVVAAELEKLKNEIRQLAPQIVAESMNNANNASAAPQQMPQQPQPAPQQYQQAPQQYAQQQYQQPQQYPQQPPVGQQYAPQDPTQQYQQPPVQPPQQ